MVKRLCEDNSIGYEAVCNYYKGYLLKHIRVITLYEMVNDSEENDEERSFKTVFKAFYEWFLR